MKYGPGLVTAPCDPMAERQAGVRVADRQVPTAKINFPAFVKLPSKLAANWRIGPTARPI